MDSTSLCLGVIVVVAIGIIVWIFYNANQKSERIRVAEGKYQSSLEELKQSPNDANLRQKTLSLGREYARVAREDGKETLFDEMALMNDINAVTGSYSTKPKEEKPKIVSRSASERLKELENLKEQGLISEDEYNTKRSAILDEM